MADDIDIKPVLPGWNRKYVLPTDGARKHKPEELQKTLPAFNGGKGGQIQDAVGQRTPHIPIHLPLPPDSDGVQQGRAWRRYTHPEGNFYWQSAEYHVVTASNPNLATTSSALLWAYQQLTGLLPPNSLGGAVELYLNVEVNLRTNATTVEYYCVDYETRQVFWLQTIDLARLGLEPANSTERILSSLKPEFWIHVEYFPCHRPLKVTARVELMSILSFGCVDDMTAPGSIGAYGARQCAEYLQAFQGFQGTDDFDISNPYEIVTIARVWTSISRVRHINGYGSPFPRLDRLQGLQEFVKARSKSSVLLTFWEMSCLFTSRRILRKLDELWNGRIVYERHWRAFFEEKRIDWAVVAGLGLFIWLSNALIVAKQQTVGSVLSTASGSLALSATAISLLLLRGHASGRLGTAPQLSSYIARVEDRNHGLRPLALVFALPFGLIAWSAFLLHIKLFLGMDLAAQENTLRAMWFGLLVIPAFLLLGYGGTTVF